MNRSIFVSFCSIVMNLAVYGAVVPDLAIAEATSSDGSLVCTGKNISQTFTFSINPKAGTIARDGKTYSALETQSFFGYIITPIDSTNTRADWNFRVGVPFAEMASSPGGVLALNGGSLHLNFECQIPAPDSQ